jgi:Zn-dependent peptidase ImmA (M78 family)/DNA-binding XRE family transcriptional regulator
MRTLIGSRLRKAREETGMNQGAFARAVGLSSEYISLLEAGKRTPSFSTLEKISAFLKKDVSYFFEHREPPFTMLLRGDALTDADRAELGRFRRYCERYLELEEITGRRLELAPLYTHSSPERLADDERRRLGLGTGPIRDIFAVVEQNGLRLLRLPFPEDSRVSGAFIHLEDKGAAFAVVNSADSPGRQAFTAAHEYGHYLKDRNDSPVVDPPDVFVDEYVSLYPPREQFAQAFAARFLMPPARVRDIVEREIRPRRVRFEDILYLKRYFGVSTQAMLRTLRNEFLIRRELFEEYFKLDSEPVERELFGNVSGTGEAKKARVAPPAGRVGTKGAKAAKPGAEPLFPGEEGEGGASAPARPRGKVIPSDRYRLLAREAAAILEARRRGESEPSPEESPDAQSPLLTEEPK